MFRKQHSLSRKLVIAAALALGASRVALADDNSMSRFGGSSYAYFNQSARSTAAASSAWRQSYPNGLTEAQLEMLSSSSLATSAFQVDHPIVASAPADTSWRQSHPNGMTTAELESKSSSSLSVWQHPNGFGNTAVASTDQVNVAQSPSKEAFSARLARIFRTQGGTQEDASQ